LKAKTKPPGFALGHATGDANGWTYWLLFSFGGRIANENNELALNSPETVAALEYAKELYQTFVPGTLSWGDPSNNKVFLAGEISLTMNGISIYYAAKTSADPKLKAMTPDIQHATFPIGPVGRDVHGCLMFPAAIYKYSKYPNAAKDYLRFIMEREQYEPWQKASIGYISHTLRAYDDNPVWSEDPQHLFYRDVVRGAVHNGYAGRLGEESAATLADFIIVDMFGEVCTGQRSPKQAMLRAEKRARRHYRA
jgi:multiple sugar transport system substrate-binding protein